MKKILVLLVALLALSGCARNYYVIIQGDGNTIIVTAEVPKKIDTSADLEASVPALP